MPSTFGALANRVIVDAKLSTYGMTAPMVMPWVVSAYEELIAQLPMGETTRQVELASQLTGPYTEGTVGITQGSDIITGTGTTWTAGFDNWFLRSSNDTTWYRINFVDATHLRAFGFGIVVPGTSSGLSYTLAQRYAGPEPSGIRWLTHVTLADSPTFHEVSIMDLDSMFPERASDPALPLYWAKAQWTRAPPYRRYVEIYPPADQYYHVTYRGYHFIDEPTFDSYAYAGIPDQSILEGALAHAFDFVAGQLVAHGGGIESVRAALDVAQRHRNVFDNLKISASRRDDRDTKGPKLTLVWGGSRKPRYFDPTSTAYWEVWRRSL